MPAADHIKILLTGASGQIGRSVIELGRQRGFEVMPFSREQLDITDAHSVSARVRESVPGLVINAAGYTAVDKAESEPEQAFAINRDGALNLARACAAMDVPLLHYSTDYVFDGTKPESYREDDRANPLGVYGASKLAGEEMIRKYCPAHIILRVSWVFSEHGTNFVKSMLQLGREQDKLHVVCDQRGCPTAARDIAEASLRIAQSIGGDFKSWGMYHYCSAPPTTWYEFSRTIFDLAAEAGYRAPQVHAITTAAYQAPARRPLNGVLNNTRFRDRFGTAPVQWRVELERVIKELTRAESR